MLGICAESLVHLELSGAMLKLNLLKVLILLRVEVVRSLVYRLLEEAIVLVLLMHKWILLILLLYL